MIHLLINFLLIIVIGYLFGKVMKLVKLPNLMGMLILGIIIGPHAMNLLHNEITEYSNQLRQFALMIIILRATLQNNNDNVNETKNQNQNKNKLIIFDETFFASLALVILPSFVETLVTTVLTIFLFNFHFSIFESILLGVGLSGISPAIIIPRLLKLKRSTSLNLILINATTLNSILTLIIFSTMLRGFNINLVFGIVLAYFLGNIVSKFFNFFNIFTLIIFSMFFMFLFGSLALFIFANQISSRISFSNSISFSINKGLKSLWFVFEIFLFVLIGSTIDFNIFNINIIIIPIIIIVIGVSSRILFLWQSFYLYRFLYLPFNRFPNCFNFDTSFSKEKNGQHLILACNIPKATVQATIATIPLNMGLEIGEMFHIVLVLSILITTPIGALLLDKQIAKKL